MIEYSVYRFLIVLLMDMLRPEAIMMHWMDS